MRKAKLIASLSLLPTIAIAPAFLSSCSKVNGSYTIMNIPNLCVLKAPTSVESPDVLVASNIFIYGPNKNVETIVAGECTATVGGTNADYIKTGSVKFVQNDDGKSVNIYATVNSNWTGESGETLPNIYFNVQFILHSGMPIHWQINATIIHDYLIKPTKKTWLIDASAGAEQVFYVTDGISSEFQVSGFTWSVQTELGFESYFSFDTTTPNKLKINSSIQTLLGTSGDETEINVIATKGSYTITKSVIVVAK